jgi:predicted ABC-class ATPase
MDRLHDLLRRIDGRGYRSYKDLQRGRFSFPRFELAIDHVQGDPYAAPSRVRVLMSRTSTALPGSALTTRARRRAARDLLARRFAGCVAGERALRIDAGGQTVLERTACLVSNDRVELRFTVELPARGRRVLGRQAWTLLGELLPEAVEHALCRIDPAEMERHCRVVEDQVALRHSLAGHGLVAFVADGSRLPRRSGIDDRPMHDPVELMAPESLRVELAAPNLGPVTGLGLARGVTLVVGGGFHGKSTLLAALQSGVWDHVPGDGRELVVTDPTAVKVRAEDGRSVAGVDISPHIGELPHGRGTRCFSTPLASGSTSQAAAVVEAVEAGARLLLVDEDTSATNFMIRDERMQALVARSSEPITPFVDRIRELYESLGVSTVLVMGGSGDYFDHADTVIQMDAYRPLDVTLRAREIAVTHQTGRQRECGAALTAPRPRVLDPASVDAQRKPGRVRVQARGVTTLVLGRSDIDLGAIEQLDDPSQVRTIGWLLARLGELDGALEPIPWLTARLAMLADGDWRWLTGRPDGDLALPRLHEVMAALNRLRDVRLE